MEAAGEAMRQDAVGDDRGGYRTTQRMDEGGGVRRKHDQQQHGDHQQFLRVVRPEAGGRGLPAGLQPGRWGE